MSQAFNTKGRDFIKGNFIFVKWLSGVRCDNDRLMNEEITQINECLVRLKEIMSLIIAEATQLSAKIQGHIDKHGLGP